MRPTVRSLVITKTRKSGDADVSERSGSHVDRIYDFKDYKKVS